MIYRIAPALLWIAFSLTSAAEPGWPQWRGPAGTGVAPDADPPQSWSETSNVRFKVTIPGRGQSTPVIQGERIYLTTAIPHGEPVAPPKHEAHGAHHNVPPIRRQKLAVLALDRFTGKTIWQREVRDELPHESIHETGSWASASPVTDGEVVIASFGSGGIYGLKLDGSVLWARDLGDMHPKHGHGEGSSPALHGDSVVVNWDHQGDSFIVALDRMTGKERWRVARDEITSWSSPLIVEVDGKPQVIIAATGRVRGYDLADGKVIWQCGGLSGNVVASPVSAGGIVYVANSYETREMLAIRLAGAKGEITGTDAVVWTRHRDTPYVPSPVLYDGKLCFLKHYQGILTCLDAEKGTPLSGPRRLQGIRNVYASLTGAAGRIYIVDLSGTTAVVGLDEGYPLLAMNRLDDSFAASPAIVDDAIYLRGSRHLYCIGAP